MEQKAKGSKRFNIVIPTMLFDRFKAVAEEKDTSMAVILNQLISDYVNGNERIAVQDLDSRVSELEVWAEQMKAKFLKLN